MHIIGVCNNNAMHYACGNTRKSFLQLKRLGTIAVITNDAYHWSKKDKTRKARPDSVHKYEMLGT